MRIQRMGDNALLVHFTPKISPEVHIQVRSLDQSIQEKHIQGLLYTIPAYASLTVVFDPFVLRYEDLIELIPPLARNIRGRTHATSGPIFKVPVCYHESLGLDWEFVETHTQLDRKTLIAYHTGQAFSVYMLGFLPGFPYLGLLPDAMHCPRKEQPRLRVPAGSVGIAGVQTGIYPSEAPGGWQLIGRTPLSIFNPTQPDPFLFKGGEKIQFFEISRTNFDTWSS